MSRKPRTIGFWRGQLPHWEVEDGRYFITIHLAGAIPPEGQSQIKSTADMLYNIVSLDSPAWLKIHRQIFANMERWLDVQPNTNWLGIPSVAELVMEAVDFRRSRFEWEVYEYTIMPSHLHIFCSVGRQGLKSTLEEFKRWTGHQALKILHGKTDRFWQDEWFDHWSRSDEQDDRIVNYIRNNPVKARLTADYQSWPYRFGTK